MSILSITPLLLLFPFATTATSSSLDSLNAPPTPQTWTLPGTRLVRRKDTRIVVLPRQFNPTAAVGGTLVDTPRVNEVTEVVTGPMRGSFAYYCMEPPKGVAGLGVADVGRVGVAEAEKMWREGVWKQLKSQAATHTSVSAATDGTPTAAGLEVAAEGAKPGTVVNEINSPMTVLTNRIKVGAMRGSFAFYGGTLGYARRVDIQTATSDASAASVTENTENTENANEATAAAPTAEPGVLNVIRAPVNEVHRLTLIGARRGSFVYYGCPPWVRV
ncbi:hypothetical protein HK102_011125 [Quaeritorhiza haematococci]|nr:hypothetical protein HK102_011125 [Quaeritorhiza haematococci]